MAGSTRHLLRPLGAALALGAATSALSAAHAAAAPPLRWQGCHEKAGFQCSTARVPLDYRHPSRGDISLAVIRHLASGGRRIGTAFFNPGGPGTPGTSFLSDAFHLFPSALRKRFDLVSWDPRGVGKSSAVHCFASAAAEQRFLGDVRIGTFPVGDDQSAAWEARLRAFDRRCGRRAVRLLPHVSTADTARDLNQLRAAFGERQLTYFGTSYGTFLGATYANLFPKRVRAMILDGNVDPTAWMSAMSSPDGASLSTFLRQGSDLGAAETMDQFLALCGAAGVSRCPFSADTPDATRAKYQTLLERLRAGPVDLGGGQGISYTELVSAAGTTLYSTRNVGVLPFVGWRQLAELFQDAWTGGTSARGAHSAARAIAAASQAAPATAGQSPAILCGESPNPRAPGVFTALDAFATARSGALGSVWTWQDAQCGGWPVTAPQRYKGPWGHRTAHPVLVVGNTVDPATPYHGSVAMSRQLSRARLLTVDGWGHTVLLNPSRCAARVENRYLINGRLPKPGKHCRPDAEPFTARK